ncbi:uncharacterized protein LOC108656004 [Drosophila navojoa]|nr:uncharacterized protein LOC108656004 [Drosophila navojoa]
MQRSSIRLVGGLYLRADASRMLFKRHIAFTPKKGFSKSSGANKNKMGSGQNVGGTTNRMETSTVEAFKRDMAKPRRLVREDNMWSDPQHMDTRWLRPRDPRRYKPDFGQTEPHTLREQFMRSPDERTRNAMGRDWEVAMRVAATRRRQAANVKPDQDMVYMRSKQELGPPQE